MCNRSDAEEHYKNGSQEHPPPSTDILKLSDFHLSTIHFRAFQPASPVPLFGIPYSGTGGRLPLFAGLLVLQSICHKRNQQHEPKGKL
jgi:hypothetical protein